jgi:hypothetical protein
MGMVPTWYDRINRRDRSEMQCDQLRRRMECRTGATYNEDLGAT